MPWTTPGTAVAGNVLTAALWNSDVRDNSLMGNPVFTNEAARDAAITAPAEGQRVYLTSPTVPAATGATTFVPSGIQTIYNGTVWECVTPVGARTIATGTTTSTSYTTSLSGSPGTNPSVTITTGTRAMVMMTCQLENTSGASATQMTFAVSGATTIAAADEYNLAISNLPANGGGQFSTTSLVSGLTAGTNTFTLNYKVTAGTGTYLRRQIIVVSFP